MSVIQPWFEKWNYILIHFSNLSFNLIGDLLDYFLALYKLYSLKWTTSRFSTNGKLMWFYFNSSHLTTTGKILKQLALLSKWRCLQHTTAQKNILVYVFLFKKPLVLNEGLTVNLLTALRKFLSLTLAGASKRRKALTSVLQSVLWMFGEFAKSQLFLKCMESLHISKVVCFYFSK